MNCANLHRNMTIFHISLVCLVNPPPKGILPDVQTRSLWLI
ncbi:hypothetical protein BMETH_1838_0 [methanotrophic bacterial endosymbiont of Bathymodiolus sp.]|nr:hypothetical protein BMETH_1838_0 [methanotrophic bacterial endosymbiont of Bathymodiolus sp.]